jgi:hypothetical protein
MKGFFFETIFHLEGNKGIAYTPLKIEKRGGQT